MFFFDDAHGGGSCLVRIFSDFDRPSADRFTNFSETRSCLHVFLRASRPSAILHIDSGTVSLAFFT